MTVASTTQLNLNSLKDFGEATEIFFVSNPKKIKPMARELFQIETVGEQQGTEKLMEEYDGKTFANSKPEGVAVKKTSAGTGYSKLARLKRFGTEIDITFEMRKYGKYSKIKSELTSLSNFCVHRQELDLSHRISFSLSSTYVNMDGEVIDITTGDNRPLCDAGHTLALSPLSYSNRLSGDPVFSQANLESMETMIASEILSNFGEKRTMAFETIFSADHTPVVNEIRRVLQSTAKIDAPNAGVTNVYEAKYRHIILPYLATNALGQRDINKKNYWGLVSSEWNGYLVEWEKENLVSPASGNNLEDAHRDVWTFGVRAGYDIAVVSAKGILISPNAS